MYTRYSVIYYSQGLNSFVVFNAHPTETLHYHLLSVANWVLFRLWSSPAAAVALVGELGGAPGPVMMEVLWDDNGP